MRILYVVHQFYPEFGSGTERVTLNLARMAQRAGHHVQVLACMLDPARHQGEAHVTLPEALSTVVEGVPVTLLHRRTLPATADFSFEINESLLPPLEAWLREQQFDLVHLMHWMRTATVIAAVQRCGIPMVLTATDFFPACYRVILVDQSGQPCSGPEAGAACARRCLSPAWTADALAQRYQQAMAVMQYASWRVAPSGYLAEHYREIFPGLAFEVIAHGVDLLKISQARAAAEPATTPTLGFIGSLIPSKGLHVLLQALARQPQLDLRLVVAGSFHGDPAYEAEIRRAVAADSRVSLLGSLLPAEVSRLVHQIDLLCLPSQVPESFSLVVHECAAAGVPSLVSHLGAPAQAIGGDGGGGVVVSDDVAAWADALRHWVTDATLATQWRQAVRLPQRLEEEAFLYECLYKQSAKVM